jgi:Effector Associated Constant Component 1
VEAEIRISGDQGSGIDAVGELADLLEWLHGERGLAGAVREVQAPPGPGELGGAVEVLIVALGSGGVAGTFVTSLFGWLRTRRPSLKVSITEKSRSMTVSAARDKDLAPLLREFLGTDDGH